MSFDINRVFPFLEQARRIRRIPSAAISKEKIIYIDLPPEYRVMGLKTKSKFQLYSLFPFSDFYILKSDRFFDIKSLAVTLSYSNSILAEVDVVDYGEIIDFVEFNHETNTAYLDILGKAFQANVNSNTRDIFNAFMNGDYIRTKELVINEFHNMMSDTIKQRGQYLPKITEEQMAKDAITYKQLSEPLGPPLAQERITTNSGINESYIHPTFYEDISEAMVIPGLNSDASQTVSSSIKTSDPIELKIDNYLSFREGSERVILLVGPTAVAKSAIVKAKAKEPRPPLAPNGFRVIDFRCAFVERIDIEGMKGITVDPETGKMLSYSALMDKMLTATDDYQLYASQKYEYLVKYLQDHPDLAIKDKQAIESLRDKFYEEMKPVILFFDEINRAPASVLNAFTMILNQKRYNNRSMKNARLIAAANDPIGLDEKYRQAYLVETFEDPATLDRFEPLVVRPQDIFKRWVDFITQDGWHPSIIEFIGDDPSKAYSMKIMQESVPDNNPDNIGLTSFPNYRTWEFVNKHITAVENSAKNKQGRKDYFSEKQIYKFIGKNAVSSAFISYLELKWPYITSNKRPSSKKHKLYNEDQMREGIASSISSGTPYLMIAPSSFGKTTRVKEVTRDMGWGEPFIVNLAQLDRTDVLGAVTTVKLHSTISKQFEMQLGSGSALAKEILSNISDFGDIPLPDEITTMAPSAEFQQRLNGLKRGEKLVVLFDEINRAESATMSAVFEAISDHRLFGVDFRDRKDDVVVIAAANYGPYYQGAGDFDPAFAARFAVDYIKEMSTKDVDLIIKYMKDNNYSKVITDYLESKNKRELVDLFMRVEERSMTSAAPSLRAFSDLDKMIKQVDDLKLTGAVIPDTESQKFIQPLPNSQTALVDTLLELLGQPPKVPGKIPDNWAGFSTSSSVDWLGTRMTTREFIDELRGVIDQIRSKSFSPDQFRATLQALNVAMRQIAGINADVYTARENELRSIIGDEVFAFQEFYNSRMGFDSLELKDVVNAQMATKWVKRREAEITVPDQLVNQLISDIKSLSLIHKSQDINKIFLWSILVDLQHPDIFRNINAASYSEDSSKKGTGKDVIKDAVLYHILDTAFLDVDWATRVVNQLGVGHLVSQEDIQNYATQSGQKTSKGGSLSTSGTPSKSYSRTDLNLMVWKDLVALGRTLGVKYAKGMTRVQYTDEVLKKMGTQIP